MASEVVKYECSCGKLFYGADGETRLNQHMLSTGHARLTVAPQESVVGTPVKVARDEREGVLGCEFFGLTTNESDIDFACGKCGWPVGRGVPKCPYCGEELFWEDRE